MFETGATYSIRMIDGDSESLSSWVVVEYEAPLLKLSNPHTNDRILNTGSRHFISAEKTEAVKNFEINIG